MSSSQQSSTPQTEEKQKDPVPPIKLYYFDQSNVYSNFVIDISNQENNGDSSVYQEYDGPNGIKFKCNKTNGYIFTISTFINHKRKIIYSSEIKKIHDRQAPPSTQSSSSTQATQKTIVRYRFSHKVGEIRGNDIYNVVIINTDESTMTFIIWNKDLKTNVQFKTEYRNLNLDELSFDVTLVQSKLIDPTTTTTADQNVTVFSVDPTNPRGVSDDHVFFHFNTPDNLLNLLKVKLSNTMLPYVRERHVSSLLDMMDGTTCGGNMVFLESMVNISLNRLLFHRYHSFHRWHKKSYILEFMVNAILASDSKKIMELCLLRETNLYPYIDKKLIVEPNTDDYKFYNNSTRQWVTIPTSPTSFKIILDTGNQSYTLIGSDFARNIGVQPADMICQKISAGSASGHSFECDWYILLKFKIPQYSDSEFVIKAFISQQNSDSLIFGWKSGLDVLYEHRFVFYKDRHKSLIKEKKHLLTLILTQAIGLLGTSASFDPDTVPDDRVDYIIRGIKTRMEQLSYSPENIKVMEELFNNYADLKFKIDRNNANNTLDMYEY